MDKKEEIAFVSELTRAQTELRVTICILMGGDEEAAKDILQETNVYLWTHAETFDASKGSFLTWAKVQAKYKVLQYRRDAMREQRRLVFDEETFELVAGTLADDREPAGTPDRHEDMLAALRHCLDLLPEAERSFVQAHYFANEPLKAIAGRYHISDCAARARMCRLRRQLDDCITRHLCTLEERDPS